MHLELGPQVRYDSSQIYRSTLSWFYFLYHRYKTQPINPMFYVRFVVDSIQVACSRSNLIYLVLGGSLYVVLGVGIGCVRYSVLHSAPIAKLLVHIV